MTHKLLCGLMLAGAVGAMTTGCSDTFNPSGDDAQGRIYATLDLDAKALAAAPRQGAPVVKAADGTITRSDLAVVLSRNDGGLEKHWDSADQFPASADYPVGDYTLEAMYGTNTSEGFAMPYYYGSAAFSVIEGKTTPVSVTARLANCMVSVSYTEAFKKYFQSYEASLCSQQGVDFAYPATETRPLYLVPGKATVNIKIVTPTGTEANLQPAIIDTEAQHHYKLTFDVNNGEAGTAYLKLIFDDSLDTEDVIIDLSDDILSAPAPTITCKGFTSGTTIEALAGESYADPLEMTVVAQGKLKSLVLTTKSQALQAAGWPEQIDLLNPGDFLTIPAMKYLGLEAFGLDTPGKMALLDFKQVLSHINYLTTAGSDNTATFTLTATDAYSKVCEQPAQLVVNLQPVNIALSNPQQLLFDETLLRCELDMNARELGKVSVEYANERGTWTKTTYTQSTPSGARKRTLPMDQYEIAVAVPADLQEVKLRASYGTTMSEILIVERTQPLAEVSLIDNDVYATYALPTLIAGTSSDVASMASRAKMQISTDGTSWSDATATNQGVDFKVSGLKGTTSYYLRVVVDGIPSHKVTFTTELPKQVNNGSFDTWTSDHTVAGHDYGDKVWTMWRPYNASDASSMGWETLNEHTCSAAGDAASNFCYDVNSATIPTDDAHSGKAALVRTVGWGGGNTFPFGNFGIVNHLTAGQLYLGTYDYTQSEWKNGVKYGIDFPSRPSSVSFYYKYVPFNSADYGYAVAQVFDAAGNMIAHSEMEKVTTQSSYIEHTLPLTYAKGSAKAAKIAIAFSSSINSDCHDINKNNLEAVKNGGNVGNLYRPSEYVGSKLYVDDVTLNY